ncbi:MAG: hypothetical protein BWZ10_03246 [candidate division BRC1 bacterium ADurb.BinA364]|nr:MAG: hypothetical protein BWZ10_03246 [candidate division BRC1 bacterium ADurb.BinA364]
MGMGVGHRQHERRARRSQFTQFGDGASMGFLVVLNLPVPVGNSGVADDARSIAGVRRLAAVPARRRPGKVGRIDVRRQPLAVAVQLIGADEVHFSRQRRQIAFAIQHVGKGGNLAVEDARIVPGAFHFRDEPPRHHAAARRRAKRTVAIRMAKKHAAVAQPVQMRHHGRLVAMHRSQERIHLIAHDQQNMRFMRNGHGSSAYCQMDARFRNEQAIRQSPRSDGNCARDRIALAKRRPND